MIKVAKITYSESLSTGHGVDFWQTILHNGQEIGWLETRFNGILNPCIESYQFAVPETRSSELDRMSCRYGESEQAGWLVVYCDTIEEFVNLYNEMHHAVVVE